MTTAAAHVDEVGMDDGVRRMAVDLVADVVVVLASDPPNPRNRRAWREWQRGRDRDRAWLLDPHSSELWCELAGIDRQCLIKHCERLGLLDNPLNGAS